MNWTFITPVEEIDHPRLWRDFAAKDVVKAELQITGLGLYRAFLNGQRVGADYLTPGCNDYDAYLRYQTYDVTAMLQERNHLEVWLGNGWYKGRFGLMSKENIWGSRYLLAARLTLTMANGEAVTVSTDESWQANASPVVFDGIYDGEVRDDTRDPGKTAACKVVETAYNVVAQFSPCIQQVAAFQPKLIVTPKGEQVLDFGQNMAGVLRYHSRLQKGQSIYVQTGEVLQEGCFYRDNLRSAKSEWRYVSDGVEQDVEPMFTFFGFRYAKVESSVPVHPEDFTAIALSSAHEKKLQAETGYPKLNQLMHNAWWGQLSNFLDVPTDCPQRDERLGWTGDTQVFASTACYHADYKDFYRKYMWDLRADQTMYFDGNIPMYSPSVRKEGGIGGAVWSDAAVIVPWTVYMHYGDKALLRESYPLMRDYADTLIRLDNADGGTHLKFSTATFGDWLAQDGLSPQSVRGGTEDALIQGVYYRYALQLTARAAEVLGETEDAARFAEQAEAVYQALMDEYVTPNGRLAVDSQTAYILALRYGLYRDREKMIDCFKRRLKRDFHRMTSGFTGAPLLLPLLFDCGMDEEAFRMLLSESFPSWLFAVNVGATTIWERWNSLNAKGRITGISMNSLNHYAYGTVCEAIYSRVMGLRCTEPGWKAAEIAPHLDGRLGHAKLAFRSPTGEWKVAWALHEDGSASLTGTVPEGTTATLVVPDDPEKRVLTLKGGDFDITWRTAHDWLHPYSADSLLMDLTKVPEAVQVLHEAFPELDAVLADERHEAQVMPLRDAGEYISREHRAQMDAVDARLKKVHC